jgi:hypothetical protein
MLKSTPGDRSENGSLGAREELPLIVLYAALYAAERRVKFSAVVAT